MKMMMVVMMTMMMVMMMTMMYCGEMWGSQGS